MRVNTTFLHSNYAPPPINFFHGYCFIGADFLYTQEGADLYLENTQRSILPALDGCYATSNKINGAHIYDVDFAGYCILYYYHDGTTWVVSNSFAQVVDYLRAQKITIKPNYTHLAASAGRGMAASQLFSLESPVHGVRVAPRTHSLVISDRSASLVKRESPFSNLNKYEDALSNYLNVWVSRFETLLTNPNADFITALTGGVDSRTNFAIIQAARARLGSLSEIPNLYCGSTPQNRTDLEVAKSVAKHYNLPVRRGRALGDKPLSPEESFEQFRSLALGIYYPLYMPTQGPSTMNINVSGGGGGVHRKIYEAQIKHKDVKRFIRSYSKHFNRPEYRVEFIHDGHNFLRTVREPGEDSLRVLLREGRVRYHTGRASRYGISLSPLHSVEANNTQLLAGSDRIEEGQFHYDVMNSLSPELLDMPFDAIEKSPTQAIRNRLVNVRFSQDANPGRVWAPENMKSETTDSSTNSRIKPYKKAFDKAVSNAFVRNFWGQDMIDLAQQRMDDLSSGKGIGEPTNGKPISSILLADLIKPI